MEKSATEHKKISRLWKVFHRDGHLRLVSARITGKAKLIYPEGTWVEPSEWLRKQGYLITAFPTFKAAKHFSLITGGLCYDIIREIEAQGVSEPEVCICDGSICSGWIIPVTDRRWPKHTLFCERIRVIPEMNDIRIKPGEKNNEQQEEA